MNETRPTDRSKTVREAVGVFHTPEQLQAAATELQTAGFNHHDISFLAGEKTIAEKLGHIYVRSRDLADEPAAPREAYNSPPDIGDAKGALIGAPMYVAATLAAGVIAATGGTLAALLGGVALAGGAAGLVGFAFANKAEQKYAEKLVDALERGGLLLWVRTPKPALEERATEILSRHGATDVHVHELKAPDATREPARRFFEAKDA